MHAAHCMREGGTSSIVKTRYHSPVLGCLTAAGLYGPCVSLTYMGPRIDPVAEARGLEMSSCMPCCRELWAVRVYSHYHGDASPLIEQDTYGGRQNQNDQAGRTSPDAGAHDTTEAKFYHSSYTGCNTKSPGSACARPESLRSVALNSQRNALPDDAHRQDLVTGLCHSPMTRPLWSRQAWACISGPHQR